MVDLTIYVYLINNQQTNKEETQMSSLKSLYELVLLLIYQLIILINLILYKFIFS